MNEVERLNRIDDLADRLLNLPKYDHLSATEVWDLAADMIDAKSRFGLEIIAAQ